MTINYTTLLGLAKPVTGTESGVWGDVVNDQITTLVEDAVASTVTLNVTASNITLSTTTGASNQARGAVLLVTGTPGTTRSIIAPSQSKIYVVLNTSDSSVVIKGAATTGVTVPSGSRALVAWNASDFVQISGDVIGPASASDNAVVRFDGATGKLIQNSAVTIADTTGDITGGKYNKVAITAPATDSTLTIADGKTLTANNSITLAGVDGKTLSVNKTLTLDGADSTTMTFPATSQTIAGLAVSSQIFTTAQTFRAASAVRSEAAATQDAVILAGRAGGTNSYAISVTPTTLSANRTFTLVDADTTAVGTDTTQTLTNKTITQRVSSTASISSPLAWNSDNFDMYAATAQAGNFTISADAGTPTDGRRAIFRIASDATPRVVTFTGGASKAFKPVGVTLTTSGSDFTYTLTASKITYFGCIYNTNSARWEIVALSQEA